MNEERLRLGLALGGGGARGYAHIGVLQALERAGIRPDAIAGTSMGAVIAAGYALHGSADEVARLVVKSAFGIGRFLAACCVPRLLERELRRQFHDARLEQLALPCAVMALDTRTGEAVVLREGPVWRAVLASTRIPFLFPPVRLDDRLLVDGGLVSLVPVRAARALGAERVVGVFAGMVGRDQDRGRPSRFSAFISAADTVGKQANKAEMAEADLLLCPRVTDRWMTDFHDRERIIAEGRAETERRLAEIRALLSPSPESSP